MEKPNILFITNDTFLVPQVEDAILQLGFKSLLVDYQYRDHAT